MGIPDFQSFFKPLLDLASDQKEHSVNETREAMSKKMNLSEKDLQDLLPSGKDKTFNNRVHWAKSYFVQAKVLESTKRAHFKITDRGLDLLKQGHERIDVKILNQYPEFVEFHTAKPNVTKGGEINNTNQLETPEELLEKAYESIRNDLAGEILSKIKGNSPQFFEKLVIDLMIALGYGGSRESAGKSIGKSGDEGIDGIINEDRLGLDIIYLQAKRWEGTVGRPEIQKFVGALHGQRARKGVFITTGRFSDDATKYVGTIDPKVILIDGKKLAELMIDYDLGTATTASYNIKKADSDYFEEE